MSSEQKFLHILLHPTVDHPAYKAGIIDENGLIKPNVDVLKDNNLFTPLDQLCFGIKRMILDMPNGANLLQKTGLALNKFSSSHINHSNFYDELQPFPFQESYEKHINFALENNLHCLYEETVIENAIQKLEEDGEAPTTTTGNVDGVTLPIGKVAKRKPVCQEQQD